MDENAYFVPGLAAPPPARGIGAYLPAMPGGVASAYIAALTQPGDLVLDPFCQTGGVLRESVALGRRALGANLNPAAVRWIETLLWPPDAQAATVALVRLGDSARGDTTLRQHVMSLYATRCPTCNKSAVAESFTWERAAGEPAPTAKRVRCTVCGTESTGPADDADVMAARRFESRGMAFWFVPQRAAPDEPDERERATAVVEAYTPRTLAALADILRKYDAASAADQTALTPVRFLRSSRRSRCIPPKRNGHALAASKSHPNSSNATSGWRWKMHSRHTLHLRCLARPARQRSPQLSLVVMRQPVS